MTLSRSVSTALCICSLHQAAAFAPSMQWQAQATLPISSSTAQHALAFPDISIPNILESKEARRSQLKQQILDLATEIERGLTATDEQKDKMQQLFAKLEKLNPTTNPLIINKNKPSVNGDWSLDYTTSDSILGKGGFPRVGKIIQNIDTTILSAKNSEVVKYAVINVPRSITAEMSPVDGKFTDVKFKKFILGPVNLMLQIHLGGHWILHI